ncbi:MULTISPECIES: hypothetical protein [Planktothricoides]|uniref:Secreted protein n=1 Tax=Planktothricoides raciborskii FACHB-1370 TaxID=2949576 RepID=A0ABR8EJ73_9CYAN|nr:MULTISPECIES: hypothetical protein [Planktothricoides]MBD2546941.1 hypothetical protein [Planktothricoides raciborskii FACHB-1370]MBD2585876.1 hypothetical protein [Planktothricoides raciborskii FACHB-1261]
MVLETFVTMRMLLFILSSFFADLSLSPISNADRLTYKINHQERSDPPSFQIIPCFAPQKINPISFVWCRRSRLCWKEILSVLLLSDRGSIPSSQLHANH